MRIGSLCSGYGGLDMAVEQFFHAETVWVSDIDPGATKILEYRWPHAPNIGDMTTVDWDHIEPIDILAAGWPCQPFSTAGKRKGTADERAIWPYVAAAIRHLRPQHVILENVAAIATAGELARAIGSLATLGYVGSWCSLRAADVGAPHGRNRIFICATDANRPLGGWDQPWSVSPRTAQRTRPQEGGRTGRDSGAHHRPGQLAAAYAGLASDPEITERRGTQPEHLGQAIRSATESGERPSTLADTEDWGQQEFADSIDGSEFRQTWADGEGLSEWVGTRTSLGDSTRGDTQGVTWGPYEPAIRRWETILRRTAPPPTEPSRNGGQRLSPHFVEWMMGIPNGWVTDVPGLTRNNQLKALGNGVVPQQASAALSVLTDRITL